MLQPYAQDPMTDTWFKLGPPVEDIEAARRSAEVTLRMQMMFAQPGSLVRWRCLAVAERDDGWPMRIASRDLETDTSLVVEPFETVVNVVAG